MVVKMWSIFLALLTIVLVQVAMADSLASFRSNEDPATFLQGRENQAVYVGSVRSAKLAGEGRSPKCTIDYTVLAMEALTGPDFRVIKICSDLHLNIGDRYLLFVDLFEDRSQVQGTVTQEGLFPIISKPDAQDEIVIEIPAYIVDFPRCLYEQGFQRSVAYPNGEAHRSDFVYVDWQKLKDAAKSMSRCRMFR